MDLVSGADLAAEINRGGPIAPEEAASYIRQAAEGLRYAHQKEVLHRDIKPANLIVDDGKLVIVDFGLAQLPRARQLNEADRLTQYGKPVGTLTFMAPEQITNSGDVDFKADIYSLGCTFFYLLTGKILHGDDLVKNLSAKQSGDTPDLAVHLPDVHESLRCVIAKMVAAAPEDRYRSYDDLLSDLESLEKGTASEPKPSGPAAPAGSGVGESFPSQPVQQHAPPLGDPSMPVNYEKPLEGGSLEGGYSARIWLLIPFAALLLAVMVTGAIGIGAFVYSSAQPAVADRAPELGGVPVEGGFNFGGSTLIQNRDLNMFAGEKGVTRLGFRETSIGDDGLEQIRALKSLKTLDLTNTQVTDHGVGFLVELPLLKDLKLVGTKVTDQGLLTLASRDSLTHLQLTGSNVTPYGWGRLRGLNLVDLHLGVQTPPSAEQWSALADFNNLDGLHLAGPGLTNDCVDHLQQLPVVTLGLRHSNISNVGIEKIADSVATGGFAGLKNLDLYKSQKITKDAVPHLIRLARAASRITRINIEDTGIASEGEMELKTALPGILLE
jgi:hypothetical protein